MTAAASPSPSSSNNAASAGNQPAGSQSSGNQFPGNHWVDVMLEFEPATAAELDGADRSERYQYLRYQAQQHRAELQAWIEQEGLEAEINHIGEATAFDLLFAQVTPAAADALLHAPGVVSVMPATDPPAAGTAGTNGAAVVNGATVVNGSTGIAGYRNGLHLRYG